MIIDTHFHWPLWEDRNVDRFLRMMDRHEIDAVILCGWEILWKLNDASHWNNEMAQFCSASPKRLFPLATVHATEGQKALDEAKRCIDELGMKGFKVHPWAQGESLFCQTTYDLCKIAGDYNVPMMFHDGTPPYAMSSQIAILACMFPQTKFVLGHSGILHYWQEAITAAKQNDNIYLTLCGGHPWGMKAICEQTDKDRIVFGTDYFTLPREEEFITYRKGLVDNLDITDDLRKKIMSDNAIKLYQLEM